ncbi:MAG TPA: cation-translocating P-type ATPase [Gemmatimonadaceae bacterium]|nr:cation-translocating P-type ATPase [Gemmatimonadaceae bacterium]
MTGPTTTEALDVQGMDCASCAVTIEGALRKLDGVRDVSVNVVGGTVRVSYEDGVVRRSDLTKAIRRAGYVVRQPAQEKNKTEPSFWSERGRLVITALSGLAFLAGFAVNSLGGRIFLATALFALATVAGGWYVVPRGARAVMSRSLDMNVLMTIAAVGAWLIGKQAEAAATMFLFAVAELLESYSMDRARNAIKALMDLSPLEARAMRDGIEVLVGVDQLQIGESVLVRPGEKLPVDGVVIEGRSSVNQAPITGESMPIEKEPGAEVFAGSLNGHGVLTVRSTKPASDSTLARIIHAVEEAQASRAPSQRFVDRFARIYTPSVVGLAVLLAIGPPLFGVGESGTWIYRALTMLVVACPCALVISTPVSIVSGLAAAARAGVLIKGGAYLEQLGTIEVLAFDKTGTLTEGRPAVTEVRSLNGENEAEVLAAAMAVERDSEHPLAKAVFAYGTARGVAAPRSSNFEALPGRGGRAGLNGSTIYVGNARLAGELNALTTDAREALRRLDDEGKTGVVVIRQAAGSTSAAAIGLIAIADRARPNARQALDALRSIGIKRILMLTGDNAGTATAIGREVGTDEVYAELLPDDKVRIVRELESGGQRIAFVGDGVNDAPALAAATVGIAMGAAGTDVALETADVALMGDDLSALARAARISQKTLGIVKQNIAVSLAIKAVFLVLAVSGWATLWMAVGADMGGSLLVVANGLRARRE